MSTSAARAATGPAVASPVSEEGAAVSEATYWEHYYGHPDLCYEWNDGRLEVRPVSDAQTYWIFEWFVLLLNRFLRAHPFAATIGLETGFRMELPDKTVVRRPDLGVVRHDNAVPLAPTDRSYRGVFDVCVESLSDSTEGEVERDTKVKKAEYEAAGVGEYFILHSSVHRAFYRLGRGGLYQPIEPDGAGVVRSTVLPGFQFRLDDLLRSRDLEELAEDPVYRGFVLPGLRQARVRARAAEGRAVEERKRAEDAELRAEGAARRAASAIEAQRAAEAENARLRALLKEQ